MIGGARRIARTVAILLGTLTLGACSPTAVASLLPAPAPPLVTMTTRGGECPDGPCGSTLVIERDGRLRQTAPEEVAMGQIPAQFVAAIATAITASDFGAIRARPFTGECPVNVDGQELIYEFGTPAGVERIASCESELDLDAPLFVAVDNALAAATPD
jgi:hypothetical protein